MYKMSFEVALEVSVGLNWAKFIKQNRGIVTPFEHAKANKVHRLSTNQLSYSFKEMTSEV